MVTWHHLVIGDFREADRISTTLQNSVFALIAAGSKQAAVFSRTEDGLDRTHLYFSPQASALAIQWGATQCQTPTRQERGGLLAGDQTYANRLA